MHYAFPDNRDILQNIINNIYLIFNKFLLIKLTTEKREKTEKTRYYVLRILIVICITN